MSVVLVHAASDENRRDGWEGSQKGDQDGKEVCYIDYPASFWNTDKTVVLRPNREDLANASAIRCAQAADNPNVGYSQPGRASFGTEMDKDPDPSHISVPCEADCSKLVSKSVQITLKTMGVATTITGNEYTAIMKQNFLASGYYSDITNQIDLTNGNNLRRGDILLIPGKHTAMVWLPERTAAAAEEAKPAETKQQVGTVITALYMREQPVSGRVIQVMPEGAVVTINGSVTASTGANWYNCTYHGATGYASAKYITVK